MKPATALAAALLLVTPAFAEQDEAAAIQQVATEQPAAPGPVSARRRVRPQQPIPEPPPPAPPLPGQEAAVDRWGDPAPIPNRSIEAPRDRFARPIGPTLEPTIIDERELNRGFTFGREHLSSRQEILLKDLAPGARIRIPLE